MCLRSQVPPGQQSRLAAMHLPGTDMFIVTKLGVQSAIELAHQLGRLQTLPGAGSGSEPGNGPA